LLTKLNVPLDCLAASPYNFLDLAIPKLTGVYSQANLEVGFNRHHSIFRFIVTTVVSCVL